MKEPLRMTDLEYAELAEKEGFLDECSRQLLIKERWKAFYRIYRMLNSNRSQMASINASQAWYTLFANTRYAGLWATTAVQKSPRDETRIDLRTRLRIKRVTGRAIRMYRTPGWQPERRLP